MNIEETRPEVSAVRRFNFSEDTPRAGLLVVSLIGVLAIVTMLALRSAAGGDPGDDPSDLFGVLGAEDGGG